MTPHPPKNIEIFSSSSILPKEEEKIFQNYSFILKHGNVDYYHYMKLSGLKVNKLIYSAIVLKSIKFYPSNLTL